MKEKIKIPFNEELEKLNKELNSSHKRNINRKKITRKKVINTLLVSIIITLIFIFVIKLGKLKEKVIKKNNTNFLLEYKDKPNTLEEKLKVKLIKEIKINKSQNKINIHIGYGFDNRLIYPAIVSMTSILENSVKNKTLVTFHIFCPDDFNDSNIDKLLSVIKKYNQNSEIEIYKTGTLFHFLRSFRDGYSNYYRIIIPEVLINLERIIYLDTDTLAFSDLSEMYLTPFENNYILGYLDMMSHAMDRFGKKTNKYICSGTILMNLEKIRKDNKIEELILYCKNNTNNTGYYDQDIINYIFHPNIGMLPLKYGMWNFKDIKHAKESYIRYIRIKIKESDILETIKHPGLVHYVFCYPKYYKKNSVYTYYPYKGQNCSEGINDFYYFANKTSFYNEIYNEYMK